MHIKKKEFCWLVFFLIGLVLFIDTTYYVQFAFAISYYCIQWFLLCLMYVWLNLLVNLYLLLRWFSLWRWLVAYNFDKVWLQFVLILLRDVADLVTIIKIFRCIPVVEMCQTKLTFFFFFVSCILMLCFSSANKQRLIDWLIAFSNKV